MTGSADYIFWEKARPWVQLIRLPNIFTAQADVLAGVIIAGSPVFCLDVVLLLGASSFLYAGGVALNDWFDEAIDRQERPERPIPSGRISKAQALILAAGALGAGILLACLAGYKTCAIALVLALLIIAYDGWLKKYAISGSVAMSMCRVLNLCLGLSLGSPPLPPFILVVPIFFYILTIMAFSRQETLENIFSHTWMVGFMCLTVTAVCLSYIGFQGMYGWKGCLIGAAPFVFAVMAAWGVMVRSKHGKPAQEIVRLLLLGLIPMDALLVGLVAGWPRSMIVLSLLFPSWWFARRFYMT